MQQKDQEDRGKKLVAGYWFGWNNQEQQEEQFL
jgi:hypothetical protein